MTTLILFGRPASGKGTVGQRLAESGYQALSTGQAMREWAAGPLPEQQELQATMAAGGYGSDELAVRIVREFIQGLPDGHASKVILDGFPRDLAQLDAWLAAPVDHGIGILVDTPETVCRERVLGRMVCGACVACGQVLQRRADDGDEDAFDRRMHDYDTRVAPIVDAWASAGLPLIRLDGTADVDAIARDLNDQMARLDGG